MLPQVKARLAVGALFATLIAGGTLLAQGALASIGLSETEARDYVLKHIGEGRPETNGVPYTPVLNAFKKMPPATRGTVVTGLYAWTKAYINSPAFKKAYADARAASAPEEHKHEGTVEEEAKAKVAKMREEAEVNYKEMLAAGMKEQAEQYKKMNEQMFEMMATTAKYDVEEQRAKDKQDDEVYAKWYADYYPPDPLTLVAKHLRAFLDTTTDVDFAAQQKKVIGEGGDSMVFVNEAYQRKPWQWKQAFEFGSDATAAGRAAAAAWLKELGAK